MKSSLTRLQLKSRKKYKSHNDELTTRVTPVQETLSRVIPLCNRIGITRISNITHLDKLGLPNFAVTVPGTEDSIWVYGGKGITKQHAKASALMEAVERYSSLHSTVSKSFVRGTYFQLSKSYNVLHPDEVVEPISRAFDDKHSIVDFLPGFDLINREEVLVPAQLALSKYFAKSPATYAFPYSHTNGLASGNVLEEAVCHALCEVIERDAVSIADLCASSIPYTILENIVVLLRKLGFPIPETLDHEFVDDSSIFQDVDISEIARLEPIKLLIGRFGLNGIPLLVKNITQKDIGIPTFVASGVEWITEDYGYLARGYGTHPDSRVALTRAITEVSQTRAANIQGARDDLRRIKYSNDEHIHERKWQFIPTSSSSVSDEHRKIINFPEIKTFLNDDVLDDIKVILDSLRKAGLSRAIIVELTNPRIGISVVRAIVPGLETFEVAKLLLSKKIAIGRRAKDHFLKILSR
jgi:thioglycine synthase